MGWTEIWLIYKRHPRNFDNKVDSGAFQMGGGDMGEADTLLCWGDRNCLQIPWGELFLGILALSCLSRAMGRVYQGCHMYHRLSPGMGPVSSQTHLGGTTSRKHVAIAKEHEDLLHLAISHKLWINFVAVCS